MAMHYDLFDPELNKLESKYASTRATLFGKFYERIIAKWLEKKEGYVLKRWQDGSVRKPRIYWNKIFLDAFDFSGEEQFEARVKQSLLSKKSHCTPDGLFSKDGKLYIWEAKNWPLYPEKGPQYQIFRYLSNYPWIFAKVCHLGSDELQISGFLFSWWNMEPQEKENIEKQVNAIIGENMFEIKLNAGIIEDCVKHQYKWYIEIIEQEEDNVIRFFNQLLGRT